MVVVVVVVVVRLRLKGRGCGCRRDWSSSLVGSLGSARGVLVGAGVGLERDAGPGRLLERWRGGWMGTAGGGEGEGGGES